MKPLSDQETRDFILKLIVESTKVVALFVSDSQGITCRVPGAVRLSHGDTIIIEVAPDRGFREAAVFTTSVATLLGLPCLFKDPRDFADVPPGSESELPMSFSLQFTFGDGSFLVLMDVSDEQG
jgi:hypothetical protein